MPFKILHLRKKNSRMGHVEKHEKALFKVLGKNSLFVTARC